MHILAVSQALKQTLSLHEVTRAMAAGIRSAGATPLVVEGSDGGDGLLDALAERLRAQKEYTVPGPLGRPVTVPVGWLDPLIALIESRLVCGLDLVPMGERGIGEPEVDGQCAHDLQGQRLRGQDERFRANRIGLQGQLVNAGARDAREDLLLRFDLDGKVGPEQDDRVAPRVPGGCRDNGGDQDDDAPMTTHHREEILQMDLAMAGAGGRFNCWCGSLNHAWVASLSVLGPAARTVRSAPIR